jgi:hypothetical protein
LLSGKRTAILGIQSVTERSLLSNTIIIAVRDSLPIYLLSSLIVLSGAVLGRSNIPLGGHPDAKEGDLLNSLAAWDGVHYVRIVEEGYSYDPNAMSNVAFFPAFPLMGRLLVVLTGCRAECALLVVGHIFLISAFITAALYVKSRGGQEDPRWTAGTLLAFGLFPTTFYFRMAYTESLFIFLLILTLYGIHCEWPPWLLAAVVGLATATRASGVVLVVPLLIAVWRRNPSAGALFVRSPLLLLIACWGILSFATFQYLAFGDPLAFMRTQSHWNQRPSIGLVEMLLRELTLEPLFCNYDPSCDCYHLHQGREPSAVFHMFFANPIYFVSFGVLLAVGVFKRWLTEGEALAGILLLLFAYFTKSYTTCMSSQARYAASVFPAYLVLGRLLQPLPRTITATFAGLSAFLLGAYAALFVQWHDLY